MVGFCPDARHPTFQREDIATMFNPKCKRFVSSALILVMLLMAMPVFAGAAQADFTLITLEATDVELDATSFTYTGREIRPNVTVRVRDQLLTLDQDYTLDYADNIEVGTGKVIVTGIATASETLGYTGTVEIPFEITPALVELTEEHVALEGTKFTYTGSYIEPKVTVAVDGKELVRDEDYTLRYHSNIGVGTATASVTGLESAGYTGQVNVNFTIEKDPEIPDFRLIPLEESHVALEGKEFPHTGKAIEPKVTVTVEGRELVRGEAYSLTYESNIAPGTGYAVIRGIATASETLGYTGEVKIPFTITKPQEETEPTQPEETKPESVTYKITKGDKSTWYHDSAKTLSFTVDADFDRFEGVQIDGKQLDSKYYTAKSGSTVITLKSAFLQKLDIGKHTITILFEDGQAEGAFKVADGLDTSNPETGDGFPMGLWMTVMAASLAGAAVLLVFRKKIFD